MNPNTNIVNSKIVLGELVSKTFLTDHIAYGYLTVLKDMKIIPSARKSNHGWMATIEDQSGNIILFSKDFYPAQEQARLKAEESLKLLK